MDMSNNGDASRRAGESPSQMPADRTRPALTALKVIALTTFAAGFIVAFIGIESARHSMFQVGAAIAAVGSLSFYLILQSGRRLHQSGRS